MTPRILQIIPTLERTGAGKQLCLLAQGLPREQFEVHVCALMRGGPWETELTSVGVPVAVIGANRNYDLNTFLNLKRLVARLNPDVIHTWSFIANVYGMAGAQAAGIQRLVTSCWRVGSGSNWLRAAIEGYIGKQSAQMVVDSSAGQDFYVAKGLPARNLRVIPPGVEMPRSVTTTRRQLLAELGLPDNSRLIGLISCLSYSSRVKDAIWAADLLKVIRKDAHLLIIGEGPQRDLFRRFRDQVRIVDQVHFLGRRDDAPRLMPHFDLLWSPGADDGQAQVMLEAMAAGVPVVAGDTPGRRELIAHRQTGFLTPLGDRTTLARWSYQLLENPGLARRVGQAAQAHVRREFTVEKMIGRHAEMYRQLLET